MRNFLITTKLCETLSAKGDYTDVRGVNNLMRILKESVSKDEIDVMHYFRMRKVVQTQKSTQEYPTLLASESCWRLLLITHQNDTLQTILMVLG